jgi:DNA-binding CsgD family transcriptional regulator
VRISLEQLSAIIDHIYHCGGEKSQWEALLSDVGTLLKAEKANLFCPSEPVPERGFWISHQIAFETWLDYTAYYHKCDVLTQAGSSQGIYRAGNVVTDESVLDKRTLRKSEFYADFWRRQGIHHAIASVVSDGRSPAVATPLIVLGLYRGAQRAAFSPDQTSVVRLLMPHLQRALRTAFLFDRKGMLSAATEWVFESSSHAFAVCAIDGLVLYANSRMERLLRAQDGLKQQQDRIVTTCGQDHAPLLRALGACAEPPSLPVRAVTDTLRIKRLSGKPAYLARVQRLPCFAKPFGLGVQATALLQITDPMEAPANLTETLSRRYGLTAAEARLAVALAQGETLKQAAQTFRVSHNTVRTQLKAALAKTGTHRQAELALLISRYAGT